MTIHNTTLKELNKILELNKKRLSLREIKMITGLSHETIRKIIKEYKKVDNNN